MNFEELVNDRISSATKISYNIINWYKETNENYKKHLPLIKESYYGMAIISYVCDFLEKYGEGDHDKISFQLKSSIENNIKLSIKNCGQIINDDVVIGTISYSSMVKDAIINNRHKIKSVYVLESGPGYEGKLLASYLDRNKIDTRVFTDLSMYEFAKSVDICIIGSDLITINGDLIHKNGTFPLCLSMNKFKKPVYSLATHEKIDKNFTEDDYYKIKNHSEINSHINRFFDFTYGELIAYYITEYGKIKPEAINNIGK